MLGNIHHVLRHAKHHICHCFCIYIQKYIAITNMALIEFKYTLNVVTTMNTTNMTYIDPYDISEPSI